MNFEIQLNVELCNTCKSKIMAFLHAKSINFKW